MSSNNETVRDSVAFNPVCNPNIDTDFGQDGLVTRLTFPCPVRQISERTIEIESIPGPVMFTDQFVERVIGLLGKRDGKRLLDDLTDRANRGLLLYQVIET